jgi:hypothetical protein
VQDRSTLHVGMVKTCRPLLCISIKTKQQVMYTLVLDIIHTRSKFLAGRIVYQ